MDMDAMASNSNSKASTTSDRLGGTPSPRSQNLQASHVSDKAKETEGPDATMVDGDAIEADARDITMIQDDEEQEADRPEVRTVVITYTRLAFTPNL